MMLAVDWSECDMQIEILSMILLPVTILPILFPVKLHSSVMGFERGQSLRGT